MERGDYFIDNAMNARVGERYGPIMLRRPVKGLTVF